MPGLVGIIDKYSGEQAQSELQSMIDSMQHESFYHSGRYIDEQLGAYLGWVCHKGSFVDCLPIWNEDKSKCLLFYGANFVDEEIVDDLKRKGHKFDSDNASYLVHMVEEKGENFYSHLNGFFQGVLIDIGNQKIVLFNDRYGMQRVYFYEDKRRFMFSSEAKALLKVCSELREITPESLGQFVSMGCILGNGSLFKDVNLLPGASIIEFKNGKCERKGRYFSPKDWEDQSPLKEDAFYDQLKETFTRILPRYVNDSRPVGMSLTGGLDTRMIMAHACRRSESLPCYTFGSMYRDSFDVKVARKVAKICKQKHVTIRLNEDYLSHFADYAEKAVYVSDGYVDAASGSAELYLNRLVRNIAPIRLTGNYGSEVLRGIRAFRYKPPNKMLFDEEISKEIHDVFRVFDENTKGKELSFAVFKQAPWFNYNRASLEQSQLIVRTPFMDNELVCLAFRAPSGAAANDQVSLRLIKDGNMELSKIITNRGAGGNWHTLVSKPMQACYEIVHLAEIGYDYGMPHWLSKVDFCLKPFYLGRLFLGRNSFSHFRVWFRDRLSDYIREMLLDGRTVARSYLNRRFVEKMVDGHIRGEGNYVREINMVITLELIQRLLIEWKS